MSTPENLAYARDAARQALSGDSLTVDELAVLLLATHLTGASEGAKAVADVSTTRARAFATYLESEANAIVDKYEGTS